MCTANHGPERGGWPEAGPAPAGAAAVRTRYGQRLTRIDKGDGDFATATAAATATATDAAAVREWLVDPLCGTLNYAVGTELVAVTAALRDGRDTPLAPTAATRLVDVNLDPPSPGAPAVSHSGPAPAADGRADRVEDAPLRAARPGNGHVAASFASRRRNADVSVGDGHRLRREYG
ncbi:inositol monophosphatase family protein [Streptomyces coelicoflavus]|nr:inositol monophosphatase family protein [Streptomyces coelicoflavus]